MPSHISVRAVQLGLGFAYAALAAWALVRKDSPYALLLSLAVLVVAWLSSQTIEEFDVMPERLWWVAGAGLIVLAAGAAALLAGSPRALDWVSVVMAYCSGNRLKAGGLIPRRPR